MALFTTNNLAAYERDGYLKLAGVFDSSEVAAIRRAYRDCIEHALEGIKIIYEDDDTTVRSIMSYHQRHPILDRYTRDSRVLKIINDIVQAPVYVSQSKINPKAPKSIGDVKGKKWAYHRGFAFWHLLDGMPKPAMVSAFIYLTEQTEENGALYALKGSHENVTVDSIKRELGFEEKGTGARADDTSEYLSLQILPKILEEYQQRYERVFLTGQPGDLMLMDSRLLHASDDNNTNKSRDVMITVYNPTDNLPQHPRQESFLCEPDHKAMTAWAA